MQVNKIKDIAGSRVILASIFLLALCLGLLLKPPKLSITYDEGLYINVARNLAKSPSNFTYQGVYMMYRPPLYPYTLSIFYRIFGYEYHLEIARTVSAVFYALTAALVYIFTVELFKDQKKGVVASLFYILNPLSFTMSNRALVHSEFSFFYTLAVFLLYKGYRDGNAKMLYASFVSAGLAILTRYTGLSIIGVFIAYLYLVSHWDWLKKKETYVGFALLALTLAPWLYLGHLYYGGALRPFSIATRVITLDTPVSAFEYLSWVLETLGIPLAILILLGFGSLEKDNVGWLVISWGAVGLAGILTVTHKEVRFLTFLMPLAGILCAQGAFLASELFSKYVPSQNRFKKVFLVIVIGITLASSTYHSLQYKQAWDGQYLEEGRTFQYASENFSPRVIGVSPRLYMLAGYYFPEAKVYQLLPTDHIKTSIREGKFDLIVWQYKTNIDKIMLEDIEESGKYKLVKEFSNGRIKVFAAYGFLQ
ncbi:phospholipid carrier-dependent glycosyltransferase [Thermococcus bergensis]|uniref:ArnT family glycosyltransferase n=1 Tax=Thermococcus bergensis TaxID=2689387 RepID=UPI001CEC5252|nr:glycosyltransferase family 39 protein [Thermococcus bergensis]MCA6214713.1 phospholipid carrier-dependent glycosyltransferase [Thermococcus bergensis]